MYSEEGGRDLENANQSISLKTRENVMTHSESKVDELRDGHIPKLLVQHCRANNCRKREEDELSRDDFLHLLHQCPSSHRPESLGLTLL